jgi:hypothetical protein
MSTPNLSRIAARSAEEVCRHFRLGAEAKQVLRPEQTPAQFLAALMEKRWAIDAIRFLAHALPKREAVWWACSCARETAPEGAGAAALAAAEAWAADPTEDNRRAARAAAEAAGLAQPGGCAAMACFWSGGSLAPADLAAVPPGEHLTARGVAGAILLAAVSEPAKAAERHGRFLALGLEVAAGTRRWKEPGSK